LRTVVVNLVLNAVQVQPGGGEVVVTATVNSGRLSLAVADRGPGVPPERVKEIFEPFRSFRSGGTGLGLAICQRLAKEQGATIGVSARAGGGSIFAVDWPVQ
jgi:signal transduction histidine kinase